MKTLIAPDPVLGTKSTRVGARIKWAALLALMVGAGFGFGGCAGYYAGYPGYRGGGYYATGAYYGSSYPYGGYPYYGNRYPYYGAPYGYGGASVVISSGRYRDRWGRWHNRGDHPRQEVRNGAQVRNGARTVPRTRPIRRVPADSSEQPMAQRAQQP